MPKVVLSLALSSRGRLILNTSMEEHLIALFGELQKSMTTPKPGIYLVPLGKMWGWFGEAPTEITVTLNFQIEPELTPAKRAALAAAFS